MTDEAFVPSNGAPVPPLFLSHKPEEDKQNVISNSASDENSSPITEVTVAIERSESVNDAPSPALASQHIGADFEEITEKEEPEKTEEVLEKAQEVEKKQASVSPTPVSCPAVSPKRPVDGRLAHVSRSTPSRRACMGTRATFGDKARAFDEL